MIVLQQYREYQLSKREVTLLDSARQARLPADRQKWIWPRDLAQQPTGWDLFEAVWAVIAEHHVIDVASIAPHPDGLPKILAKPGRRLREEVTRRGGGGNKILTHHADCAINQGGGVCNRECGSASDEWSPTTPNR